MERSKIEDRDGLDFRQMDTILHGKDKVAIASVLGERYGIQIPQEKVEIMSLSAFQTVALILFQECG
ncbi:hypothetical protein [Frankia sp. AgKG'84/4]|uniref:hypothetical protein n=1 Tax=Frankia sp. AgKG'84/4 TaxID=573490 RepID=UPI00200FB1D5|nr:hypothetical protein [Frankia sp. AgKG'84/4]MCL9795772.1 hypothetical protein [Frankia sp. AgKG'84/4]